MKNLILFLLITASTITISCQPDAKNDSYKTIREAFSNPPDEARPKVYWWCLNGNIDTIRAKEELRAMKEAGITGFDLFEIGVPEQDTMIPGGPSFLSDESLRLIKFAVDEAGKLGLSVGLNLASSWNAGGSWVKPEHGAKSLYVSKTAVSGISEKQTIKLSFPKISFPKESLIGGTGNPMIPFREDGKPVYYEELAILAIPASVGKNQLDTANIVDVTPFFNPETDELNWEAPAGNWEICRYVSSNSGQQVVRPSPQSAGLTIDHFDAEAVESHLMYIINKLKPVLGDFRNTALKSFYLASYEARGFVWTSTLPSEFKKVNGYEIRKFIPSLFDPELFDEETTKKIQSDFKKTLSELMINNLYKKSKEICNQYGLKINSEAGGPGYPLYNGPAEPLKAQGALDIPRGEFWVNHGRFYQDGDDSIDILRVVKEVAAASHIYQKRIVELEAFTSFQHWQEGPFDLKQFGDRAFCEGMNRVVFHGFSHNIIGSGFPGFVYGAGTHFNDKRVWWPKVKPFVDYLSRISAVFQKTEFVADVLWYYGDKVPNSATPKNTHFKVGPGYDYEVINTEILLNNLSVKNGKLVLTNGAEFDLLALENEEVIHPAVLKKLNELAKQGAVIIGEKPKKVDQLANYPVSGTNGNDQITQLWTNIDNPSEVVLDKKGIIYSGISPIEMLKIIRVQPDIFYIGNESELLDFIHFSKNENDIYFIRNTQNEWLSRNVGFRQQSKIPEIWNPLTGDVVSVPVYYQQDKYINIPITLPPFGSYFVVFKDGVATAPYTHVSTSSKNPPLMEFTHDGILFMKEGTYELQNNLGIKRVENKQKTQVLDGDWKVNFSKGWGAPDSAVFPGLSSWTDNKNDGIKYYSGIGTYHKTFEFERNASLSAGEKIFLDLGNISKVAEVWLNGQSMGIVWAKPYRYDVTNLIKNGENILTVEVANTWSNRLTGDAITGEKYTNTNILNTVLPGNSIVTSDQTRVPWAKVPLIESGLLGPVILQTVRLVQ